MAGPALAAGIAAVPGILSFLGGGPDVPEELRQAAQAETRLKLMRESLLRDLLGEARQMRTDSGNDLRRIFDELGGGVSLQNMGLDVPFNSAETFQNALGNGSRLQNRIFFDRLAQIANMTRGGGQSAQSMARLEQAMNQAEASSLGQAAGNIMQILQMSDLFSDVLGDDSTPDDSGFQGFDFDFGGLI